MTYSIYVKKILISGRPTVGRVEPTDDRMLANIFPQIEDWRRHLLGTSKRNRLVNFKFGRTGGVNLVYPNALTFWQRLLIEEKALVFPWKRDLIDLPPEEDAPEGETKDSNGLVDDFGGSSTSRPPEPEITQRCLASPRLKGEHLLTSLSDKEFNARLKRLDLNAREAESELGMNTLFAAFGFLRWFESDNSDQPVLSPLLLVPVRIERESVESPWIIRFEEEEARRNDTLAELMKSDHRVSLPQVEEVLDDPEDLSDLLGRYVKVVADRVKHHKCWEVQPEAALGNFHFQKLAIWEDLGANAERIANHPICRGIAGDRDAVPVAPSGLPQAQDLDDAVAPQDVVHILDADSSQHAAIEAVKRGANLVLDGPPGTGKSQTIANLIAEYLAAGKTVLFVSEKTAALDVVKKRLDDRRLGDFCLELHSHKANKREVVGELGRCLNLPTTSYHDPAETMSELAEARRRLNSYVRTLHLKREPLGMSLYQAHGELARSERLAYRTRCPIHDPLRVDGSQLRRISDILAVLPDCLEVLESRDRHPWRGRLAKVYSLGLRDDLVRRGLLPALPAPPRAAIAVKYPLEYFMVG